MKNFLTSSWWLILNAGYLLLILLVSLIAFVVPEQTKDFIYVFLQDWDVNYVTAVYISLATWCFITWYSGCIILQIDPLRASLARRNNQGHIDRSIFIPKLLGVMPCLIFIYAIGPSEHFSEKYTMLHVIISMGIAIGMWILFEVIDKKSDVRANVGASTPNRNPQSDQTYKVPRGFRAAIRYIWSIPKLGVWPSLQEVELFKRQTKNSPSLEQELVFISQFTGVTFYYKWLGSFCLALTITMCFPKANLFLTAWLRPGAVLILSLASFTLLFTIIAYFHDYARRPFGIAVLGLVVVFSYFNDNTCLEYLENSKAGKRPALDAAFTGWLKERKGSWARSHPGQKMPIIFIATQGGGIRGMTWTTRVLHHLDSAHRGFMDQTFLISGVSGGGVGATAYLSWLHDQKSTNQRACTYSEFDSFTKKDFLSPVVAAFAFGDFFQRFLPVPFPSLDRSKMLGMSWDKYYKACTGRNSLSNSFLEMWPSDNRFAIPSLILNGTLAENGQRVVTSNLDISKSRWFEDDIDFFSFSGKDISRSTAALNCSRFPVITSGGLLERGATRKGHIVDGGYRENTGLQTLLNVFCEIRPIIKSDTTVNVLILYLQNGVDERNDEVKASRWMQDLAVPMQGLVQVNGTGLPAKSIVQFVSQFMDQSIFPNVRFFPLKLDARDIKTIKLPLGWYMSDVVSKEIDKRVKAIPTIDQEATTVMDEWLENKPK